MTIHASILTHRPGPELAGLMFFTGSSSLTFLRPRGQTHTRVKLNHMPPTDGKGAHGNSRNYFCKKRDRNLKTIDVLLASLY